MTAILFDLDGVLIHSRDAWYRLALAAVRDLGGEPVDEGTFDETFGQGAEEDVEMMRLRCTPAELHDYYAQNFPRFMDHVKVEPDAQVALGRMQSFGLRLGVVTNTVTRLAFALVERAGIAPHFEEVLGADLVPSPKPAPDLIELALQRLGVQAASSRMVGDSVYDAEAAAGAGVAFVGFRREGDPRVESLSELADLVTANT